MSARDRITKNCEHGRTSKECIQNTKRFTGGAIFRNGSSRLGQNILQVQREIKEAAWDKREGKHKNNIQDYRDNNKQINEYSPRSH